MDSKLVGLSKMIPTVNESSRSIGLPFLDTETSAPWTGEPSNPLTCSAEASRVKTLASPGKGRDSAEREAASGLSTSKPSTRSSRSTSSSKMWQPFALEDWIKCSGKSLRSATMRNGIVYPLPPLALLTGGIGCGLWRTPSAQMAGEGPLLGTLVTKEGEPAKQGERAYNPKIGKHVQITLNREVKMWPTPSVCGNYNRKGASSTSGDGLATKVWNSMNESCANGMDLRENGMKMFPTPNARDHKDSGQNTNCEALAKKSKLAGVAGGSLNPQWVSWLMGYPVDWCDLPDESLPASRTVSRNLKDSAMPSSLK